MGNNFHKSSVVARRLAAAHKMPLPSRLGVTTSSFEDTFSTQIVVWFDLLIGDIVSFHG